MRKFLYALLPVLALTMAVGCSSKPKDSADGILKDGVANRTEAIKKFENIIDITNTPERLRETRGLFMDRGSWLGYAPPAIGADMSGFVGPMEVRHNRYYSYNMVSLKDPNEPDAKAEVLETAYFPGSLYMKGKVGSVEFEQNMYFVDANNAVIKIQVNDKPVIVYGNIVGPKKDMRVINRSFIADIAEDEGVVVSLPSGFNMSITDNGYSAESSKSVKTTYAVVSFFDTQELLTKLEKTEVPSILKNPEEYIAESIRRWDGYINKTLRPGMPAEFDRVAVKSIVTLMSNWKRSRGDLFHDGIVPSHAVSYFDGFWAWDSWKHAYAVVDYEPELAKDQVRTMFDYQDDRGMVIDCIYVDAEENNARDSKSSLATWAVERIFEVTQDTAFVKEMYPKLVDYYNWWFVDRDRDGNGIVEFGSTDGTLVAAKWESGMDNAVRFDDTKIHPVNDHAWSFGQESVDLNGFLNYERQGLERLAKIVGDTTLNLPDHSEKIQYYFWDPKSKFYYDMDMEKNRLMTNVQGPEAWIPLFTKAATPEQAEGVMEMIRKPNKFSTYIPFPTCARDAKGFNNTGYWRGAVWMDQAYFGIRGIRNYGYNEEADTYTEQIFTRPDGLTGTAPIYENYEPLEGRHAQAPHFSWSAAHLLMLYKDYKTK